MRTGMPNQPTPTSRRSHSASNKWEFNPGDSRGSVSRGFAMTLVLALMPVGLPTYLIPSDEASVFALYSAFSLLNWKYLVLGFILFRVFDIWKPFPARRLEHLPHGWGVMADDWMAGVYAAILLRLALHFNLV